MSSIEEVKGRLDIADVVSSYVQLQKSGRNFKAACPFHQEKTPSFFVFPERQSWRCFGACGTGGDVFSFVMKADNIDFGEALRRLAERAGVTLPQRRQEKEGADAKKRLYFTNDLAAAFYHQFLKESPEASMAREYFERRGVVDSAIDEFQLGYSPSGWEGLRSYLLKQEVSETDQSAAGLLVEGERGFYDRFRGRLMFPVRDSQGRVCGFGGRALDDSTPKYLNTPQTAVFDKSGTLYGLDLAQGAVKDEGLAVVVEGYMDVIAAHQAGIKNVVASMGTAITEKQMKMLNRLTKRIALALDADAAGQAATRRGLEVARTAGERTERSLASWLASTSTLATEVRVFAMPQGKDPDDVIKESPELWQELVQKAQPGMDYLFEATLQELDISQPRGKSAAVDRLLPMVVELGDPVQQELYLGRLSRLAGVNERTLQGVAAGLRQKERSKTHRRQSRAPVRNESSAPRELRDKLEEYTLALILKNQISKGTIQSLSDAHFEHMANGEIFKAWLESQSLESLRGQLDEVLHEHLEVILSTKLPEGPVEPALSDCIRRLDERRLRRTKEQEAELIAEAEAGGNPRELADAAHALWLNQEDDGDPVDDDAARQAALRQMGLETNAMLGKLFNKETGE
jgi:DNA primase